MSAQNEAAEVLAEWKTTFAEVFPHHDPEAMRVKDADLALAVMIDRKIKRLMVQMAERTRPDYDRMAKHNPTDPE